MHKKIEKISLSSYQYRLRSSLNHQGLLSNLCIIVDLLIITPKILLKCKLTEDNAKMITLKCIVK